LNEIYLKHLTKPHTLAEIGNLLLHRSDGIEKLMERDYFLDAQQALEMGLVDKVLTSREETEKAMAPLRGERSGNDISGNDGNDGKGESGGNAGVPPPNPARNPDSS
jgi:hypothetical protein